MPSAEQRVDRTERHFGARLPLTEGASKARTECPIWSGSESHDGSRSPTRRTATQLRYRWDALTRAEREAAGLVAQGFTNAKVADSLRTSRFTVDGRLRRVFTELEVSTRVELTAGYGRLGR
jgi:DNA-binding CsgD family transcriptional regulator